MSPCGYTNVWYLAKKNNTSISMWEFGIQGASTDSLLNTGIKTLASKYVKQFTDWKIFLDKIQDFHFYSGYLQRLLSFSICTCSQWCNDVKCITKKICSKFQKCHNNILLHTIHWAMHFFSSFGQPNSVNVNFNFLAAASHMLLKLNIK